MKKVLIILALGLFIISCNTNQQQMQTTTNPFFTEYGTPYDVPPFDKIKNEHFLSAFKEGMKQQSEEIDAIANNTEPPAFENTLVAMDRSSELLTNVSSVFYNLSSANTNEKNCLSA
jgi:peptidyl-dipeptidase Dcp